MRGKRWYYLLWDQVGKQWSQTVQGATIGRAEDCGKQEAHTFYRWVAHLQAKCLMGKLDQGGQTHYPKRGQNLDFQAKSSNNKILVIYSYK